MSGVPNLPHFFDEKEVELVKLNQPQSLPPFQAEAPKIVSQTLAEIDHVFSGPISDENIEFVNSLASDWNCSTDNVSDRLRNMKPGTYFLSRGQAYMRTHGGTVQEAASYVNVLEKATANVGKIIAQKEARLTYLENLSFWQRLRLLFKGAKNV